MRLITRNGRTESQIEGKDYLTTEGQFSSDSNKHYLTAGGKATKGSDEPPTPPTPPTPSYTIELPDTVDGGFMYDGDKTLGDEVVYAPVLESGVTMFRGSSITSFDGDLPALTNGHSMFAGCFSLTSFAGDLPALTSGTQMFYGCGSLTSFAGDLSALDNGKLMFYGCKLDFDSAQRIVNSVPSYISGTHEIYIGVDSAQVTQEQQDEADVILTEKGWTVAWQRN